MDFLYGDYKERYIPEVSKGEATVRDIISTFDPTMGVASEFFFSLFDVGREQKRRDEEARQRELERQRRRAIEKIGIASFQQQMRERDKQLRKEMEAQKQREAENMLIKRAMRQDLQAAQQELQLAQSKAKQQTASRSNQLKLQQQQMAQEQKAYEQSLRSEAQQAAKTIQAQQQALALSTPRRQIASVSSKGIRGRGVDPLAERLKGKQRTKK